METSTEWAIHILLYATLQCESLEGILILYNAIHHLEKR